MRLVEADVLLAELRSERTSFAAAESVDS